MDKTFFIAPNTDLACEVFPEVLDLTQELKRKGYKQLWISPRAEFFTPDDGFQDTQVSWMVSWLDQQPNNSDWNYVPAEEWLEEHIRFLNV